MTEISNFILQVIAVGGGAAAFAYLIFTWLGKTWLENKFSERLEEYKRKQNQELEHYRYEINTLFNRVSKIHEKEFDVLPEAWKKLQDALGLVNVLTEPLQVYADLNSMNGGQFDEFLRKSNLDEFDKTRLIESTDKNQMYQEIRSLQKLHSAIDAVDKFHNYLLYNKIFLTKDLFDCFSKVDNSLKEVVTNWQYKKQRVFGYDTKVPYKTITDEILITVKDIEKYVQERLHYMEA